MINTYSPAASIAIVYAFTAHTGSVGCPQQHIHHIMTSDYTTSNNPQALYFAEIHQPFPDWVAAHPIPTADKFEKCASAAFADIDRRLLPVRDKVSTFHSAIDLFANAADYSAEVFNRIKNACEFHGIADDVAPYAELFASKVEKSASADVCAPGKFAINQEFNGVAYTLLPLNDAQDVKDSGHELAKMASDNRIHFVTLFPAAQEIAKAAADFGVADLPGIVQRIGPARCANFEKAARLLEGRELLSKSADQDALRQAYTDAVTEAATTNDADGCVMKIAAIDDAAGIRYNYSAGSRVLLPSEIVYTGPLVADVEKAAAANVAVGDILIPLHELQKLDLLAADFKLSKEAAASLRNTINTTDAKDVSIALMSWCDTDRRTLLRMAAAL